MKRLAYFLVVAGFVAGGYYFLDWYYMEPVALGETPDLQIGSGVTPDLSGGAGKQADLGPSTDGPDAGRADEDASQGFVSSDGTGEDRANNLILKLRRRD